MAKKKIIIHYDDGMRLYDVIKRVLKVISMGRISRARGHEQFCFVSDFFDSFVYVKEKRNKMTDTFMVRKKDTK